MKPDAAQPVICIMGPTASGKTALAVELAKAANGEVISVDSALIYKDMDIGTAKPDAQEMQDIPHHLIDIRTPEETYSVADFVRDANKLINDIQVRGKLAILAGGTMMYFNALQRGISDIPAANPEVRDKVQALIAQNGLQWLHEQLQKVDAPSAEKIHPNDPQRLTRAMEVYYSTNKPLSQWQENKLADLPYRFINFALMPKERAFLHERIAQRFKLMLDAGLLGEVKTLLSQYNLHPDLPSMRSVGYRQVIQYFDGELDYDALVERGIIATRQLAKRQITWLRGWEDTEILEINNKLNLSIVLEKVCVTHQ